MQHLVVNNNQNKITTNEQFAIRSLYQMNLTEILNVIMYEN